jgi:hypothetical protein
MKRFALPTILFCLVAGPAHAQITITYVQSQASGDVSVSGYTENSQSASGPNTAGPPYNSGTISGASGAVGGNYASYSSSISNSIPPGGGTITTAGAYSINYTVPTAQLLVGNASVYQEIQFTLATAQIITITGTLTQGNAYLYNPTQVNPYAFNFSAGAETPVSYSVYIAPGGTYEFVSTAGISYAPPATYPGSSGSASGGFNFTITTQNAVVPEPSSLVLATLAGLGVAGGIWRRRFAKKQTPSIPDLTPNRPLD